MSEEQDLRSFIREQTLRMEAATRHMERALERMGDRMEATLSDQSDHLRANTAATWAMVDEIKGLSR